MHYTGCQLCFHIGSFPFSIANLEDPTLDVFFFGFWFRWFFLRLSGILCGITSSLRIRKNFFDFLDFSISYSFYIYKKRKRFCPWWGLNTQPCESQPIALSTEPSCLLISSNISHFLLYVIWNRKSALRSLNQEKSKKFFLILKLEIIPHRNPLRRKNNHRKCQKEVL